MAGDRRIRAADRDHEAEGLTPVTRALVWIAIGLYGVPAVLKYVQVFRDRGLNHG
jgi:hypothetical protein